MAHPTRTGDLVVFSYPPYQFDAATPGTLVALVALLRPARLRAGRPGPRRQHQHAGDVPRRRRGHRQGRGHARASIDLAPTLAFLLGIPEPQHSQGRVLLDDRRRAAAATSRSRSSASTTSTASSTRRRMVYRRAQRARSAAAAYLATLFDEELASLPGPGLLLAGGDNVGASPPNSALLEDMPAIDVENAWGLDATSLRQPRVRLRGRAAPGATRRAPTSRSSRRTSSRPRPARPPAWVNAVGRVHRQRHQGRRHRRRARERRPSSCPPAPPPGSRSSPEAPADQGRVRAPPQAGRQGPGRRDPRGHRTTARNTVGNAAGAAVGRPDRRRSPRPSRTRRRRDHRRATPTGSRT